MWLHPLTSEHLDVATIHKVYASNNDNLLHIYDLLRCVLTQTLLYLYTRELKFTVKLFDVQYNYICSAHKLALVVVTLCGLCRAVDII